MIIRPGEGVLPIVGIVKVIVERTAWVVSVEVVVRKIEADRFGIWRWRSLRDVEALIVVRPPWFMRVKALWMLRRKLLRGEKWVKFFSQSDQDEADELKDFEVATCDVVHIKFLLQQFNIFYEVYDIVDGSEIQICVRVRNLLLLHSSERTNLPIFLQLQLVENWWIQESLNTTL